MQRLDLCCIDFSGVYWRFWHALINEEVSEAHNRTVQRVINYAAKHNHAAICIDSPPYKRGEIDPTYKQNREKQPEVAIEQLKAATKRLRADGYHVIGAKGYEADDVIGTICKWSEFEGHSMTVYSADKDLLQLVTENTIVISTANGDRYETENDVIAKLGVAPRLVSDLLALTGDGSDNIPGIKGCGPKTASKWLDEHEHLGGVISNAADLGRFADQVRDNASQLGDWHLMTQLMTAPVDPASILNPVVPIKSEQPKYDVDQEVEMFPDEPKEVEIDAGELACETTPTIPEEPEPEMVETQAIEVIKPKPIEWERELEPRDRNAAWNCARMMVETRFFKDIAKPEQALAVIMTGREFGMSAMSSLQAFHIIRNKVCPSAQTLVGLVKRSPACVYFMLTDSSTDHATWETQREGEPKPTTLTYDMAMAKRMGLDGKDNWRKQPDTMLRWRAASALARAVYPDVVGGLYTAEEMWDQ